MLTETPGGLFALLQLYSLSGCVQRGSGWICNGIFAKRVEKNIFAIVLVKAGAMDETTCMRVDVEIVQNSINGLLMCFFF